MRAIEKPVLRMCLPLKNIHAHLELSKCELFVDDLLCKVNHVISDWFPLRRIAESKEIYIPSCSTKPLIIVWPILNDGTRFFIDFRLFSGAAPTSAFEELARSCIGLSFALMLLLNMGIKSRIWQVPFATTALEISSSVVILCSSSIFKFAIMSPTGSILTISSIGILLPISVSIIVFRVRLLWIFLFLYGILHFFITFLILKSRILLLVHLLHS